MAFAPKVYVVQKADDAGNLGEVLAVKLTFEAAHKIAKDNAPAGVERFVADKLPYIATRQQPS